MRPRGIPPQQFRPAANRALAAPAAWIVPRNASHGWRNMARHNWRHGPGQHSGGSFAVRFGPGIDTCIAGTSLARTSVAGTSVVGTSLGGISVVGPSFVGTRGGEGVDA